MSEAYWLQAAAVARMMTWRAPCLAEREQMEKHYLEFAKKAAEKDAGGGGRKYA